MRFHFAVLFLHEMTQQTLHRLERIVNHFVERLVRAVIHLLFIRDELVARRDRHVDTTTIWISFLMRVVRLFDRDIATIDVIAKLFQPRRFF